MAINGCRIKPPSASVSVGDGNPCGSRNLLQPHVPALCKSKYRGPVDCVRSLRSNPNGCASRIGDDQTEAVSYRTAPGCSGKRVVNIRRAGVDVSVVFRSGRDDRV